MSAFDENTVYDVLKALLPEKNDYFETDYKEELEELLYFNIETEADLRRLIEKHLDVLIASDEEPIDEEDQKLYAQELGAEFVKDAVERKYWFAFPGLLRLALELEFGDDYKDFSNERDSV